MASEIQIETENSPKTQEKDTGSNHVVPVMLTFYNSDLKTVKEVGLDSRVYINSKENENIMSFHSNIIIFLGIKEQAHSLRVPGFYLTNLQGEFKGIYRENNSKT